jgi:amylosucrase
MTAAEFATALLDQLKPSKYQEAELSARIGRYFPELCEGLRVYPNPDAVLKQLVPLMAEHLKGRSPELQALDLERIHTPDWFEKPEMVGYIAYTELFAGTIKGVEDTIPYLQELGIKYLHLMPFLKPRPAPHDGGYAVADYRKIRADLGSIEDLETLCGKLHKAGISLCCDLVLNHVAQEHQWAERARRGEAKYQNYFLIYKDRTLPDQYEKTLPEVFPEFKPGNFTWNDTLQAWVWTTFNTWQWDLNWANPEVWLEFADIICWLAGKGVDVFRLDAIAFTWKRMGTNCQNQPEVHAISQALRAVLRMVAPAVLFKAEAIVAPEDLIAYLGQGQHHGKVSDLAYHNSLMVQIWSSLAARDTRIMTQALRRFPPKPSNTAWVTYLRCHDDIGWAISDVDAAAVGFNGAAHRRFLADFYKGDFAGSFSRGMHFQDNPDTGDRRTSGSAASLAGLEHALELGDARQIDLAVERILLAHAVFIGYGEGIPLIYMGDELAMLNDYRYTENAEHAEDNRWLHRPQMDWARAERRKQAGSLENRVFGGIRHLLHTRAQTPHLHSAVVTEALWQPNPHLLVLKRQHALGTMVQLYNFSEEPQPVPWDTLWQAHLSPNAIQDHLTARPFAGNLLAGYGRYWLTAM